VSRIVGADKPPGWDLGWDGWSPTAKVEHLLGMSLDRIHDYLGWSPHEPDPHRLAAQSQPRVVVMIAAKVGIEAQRQAVVDQERLAELARRLSGKDLPELAPHSGKLGLREKCGSPRKLRAIFGTSHSLVV
jgi:hypothetical protein